MTNLFFAPSKATVESPLILDFLKTFAHVRFAEANAKSNQTLLRRLKNSSADVTHSACILTAPTVNVFDGDLIPVGRGIYDIGDYALQLSLPCFICRFTEETGYLFYPVLDLNTSLATGDWKLDYARARVEEAVRKEVAFP